MILSTKCSIKFINVEKKNILQNFMCLYKETVQLYINDLWQQVLDNKIITKQFRKENYPVIPENSLTDRAKCLAIQQASSIVRGAQEVLKLKTKELEKLEIETELNTKEIHKNKQIIEKLKKVPSVTYKCVLDSKLIKIEKGKNTFDLWITLSGFTTIKRGFKILIPLKKHNHFNKLESLGNLLGGIILTDDYIQFNFEIKNTPKKQGETVGIDIGDNHLFNISNSDHLLFRENHKLRKYDYKEICNKLKRCKSGSKRQLRLFELRKNYICEQFNKLDFSKIKTLKREKLYNFRFWKYSFIVDNLDKILFLKNVSLEMVNPKYTSQRCSECGWVHYLNRKGDIFRCKKCFACYQADMNASRNIAKTLPKLTNENSRSGFYWNEIDKSLESLSPTKTNE